MFSKPRDYTNKVVAVSGGGGGLGLAFARRLARAGAKAALLDLPGDRLHEAAARLGYEGFEALPVACDVTRPADCHRAVLTVLERFGRLDVLINNAGITHRSPFAHTSLEVYRRVMEVNYFGSLNLTRAALGSLVIAKGQIVVTSSVSGFAPLLGRTGYSASKHALHGFFDSLRTELAPQRVGVTIVCPSFAKTGIGASALDGDGSVTSHPQSTLGRVVMPDEVAEAMFKGVSRNRRLVVHSPVGKLTRFLTRVAPGLYEKLMAHSLRQELER